MSATAKSIRNSSAPSQDARETDKTLQHVVAGDSANPPLIPAGGVFDGQVSVRGETRIDGTIRGTLRGSGRLELGPDARVEGEIECEDLRCQGAVVGPVVAHERAELGAGANLEGDIETPRLEVAETAIWTGAARVGGATED